jgi:diguanylate cyclase (GGDEF)-like protein
MLYTLLAFALGALAAALVLAGREHRRASALHGRLEAARDELASLERRDGDTGLYNSRHFVEALTREIERARTYGRPVALALASVDEASRLGQAGAEVLRALGSAIGGSVRALDVPCRVGGTEFAVILPETDSRSASVASERVLRSLARVQADDYQPQAAIGIASCPAHADTFEELVERAGSALRSARRAARSGGGSPGTVTVSLAVWDESEE